MVSGNRSGGYLFGVPKLLSRVINLGVSPDLPNLDAKHVRITNIVAMLGAIIILPWIPVDYFLADVSLAIQNSLGGFLMLGALLLN